jgi:hypothetical protein
MNANMKLEGAPLRQRMTYQFDSVPPRANPLDLSYLRASGLAQMRLQLAVLSGNRRGALRELDRLVEIDRELEALTIQGRDAGGAPGAGLIAQLDEQRQAIATEKLALMAAIEFPRLAPADRAAEQAVPPAEEEEGLEVVEDAEFGRRLLYGLAGLLAVIAFGTALAFGLPLLATV